jgi:L,D-transpeptidase YcbB
MIYPFFKMSAFLGTLSIPFTVVSLNAAHAQNALPQAEWQQSYDSASRTRVARSTTPMLSPQSMAATEEALARYQDIAARGGWQPLQLSERLRLGMNNPAVPMLRQRLILSGDLDPTAGSGAIYDTFVDAAVRRFQIRHGLTVNGVLNPATLVALNIPVDIRVRQLELNLVRLRAYSGDLGNRSVTVNIPSASVEAVENGFVVSHHAAGVGKVDRQSPIMNAKITEVNFNPFWTVPASIIRKDLIPKMQKDPTYLKENRIRIFTHQGQELDPATVNWSSDEGTRYMFRQDPGGDLNSMGFVRINIPNVHGVYMHDTPSKGIFGDDFRFVSSGCVRVQNVRDYIAFLLRETPGWSREAIDEAFESGKRLDAKLTQPVNVYWTYITAWATPEGVIHFRDDIYSRDGLGAIPMAQAPGDPDVEQIH